MGIEWTDEIVDAVAKKLIDIDNVFEGYHQTHMAIFRARAKTVLPIIAEFVDAKFVDREASKRFAIAHGNLRRAEALEEAAKIAEDYEYKDVDIPGIILSLKDRA